MLLIRIMLLLIPLLGLPACLTYEAKPLDPPGILEEIRETRRLASEEGGKAFGFPKAAQWLHCHGPGLKRARAAYEKAAAVAAIETPLPNPEVVLGTQIGSNLGSEGRSHRIQPLVEFGFTLPLSSRLGYEDDLNRALAEAARTALLVEHRKGYLELRQLVTEWILARRHREVLDKIHRSSKQSLELTRRLVEAGAASALDVGLMELEAARHEVDLLDAAILEAEKREALSALIGIPFPENPSLELWSLDLAIPDLESAMETLVANNPDLALVRADYETAEKALRLEVEKQYPDLVLGSSFEGDPGDRKKVWGLSLGIALPLFDRNLQAIRGAEMERERARAEYESLLNESLARLEGLHHVFLLALEKKELLQNRVLPVAEANLEVAFQSMRAAALDSLKYLEVERTLRLAMLDALSAEEEVRRIICFMEQVVGVPLTFFPGENPEDYPFIPDQTRKPNHER